MENNIKVIKEKYQTGSLEQCLEAIELSKIIVDEIVMMSISLLENKNLDTFLVTEKISTLFEGYLKRLYLLLESENKDLNFWASCLLVHHCVKNIKAENNLLNQVQYGEIEKAQISTTILAKSKNLSLSDSINQRLEQKDLKDIDRHFFEEKINDLSNL